MMEIVRNPVFNSVKAEPFAGQLLTALNAGSLCLMISICHRTGLFDTLSMLPPSTSVEIAQSGFQLHHHEPIGT